MVSMVNRTSITCGDDTRAPECFVEGIDWSATALPASVARSYQERIVNGEQLILQGDIMGPDPFQPKILFGVNEVWVGAVDTTDQYFVMDGVFVMEKFNGTFCITAPCPNIAETRLNANRSATIADIDFDDAGLSDETVNRALEAVNTDGLIVVGERYYSQGEKGRTAAQVFMKAAVPQF